MPTILTVEEAAAHLRIGASTCYRLVARGIIPAVRVPGTSVVRVRLAALEALLHDWEGRQARGRRRTGRAVI